MPKVSEEFGDLQFANSTRIARIGCFFNIGRVCGFVAIDAIGSYRRAAIELGWTLTQVGLEEKGCERIPLAL